MRCQQQQQAKATEYAATTSQQPARHGKLPHSIPVHLLLDTQLPAGSDGTSQATHAKTEGMQPSELDKLFDKTTLVRWWERMG